MAQYINLPDGTRFELLRGESPQEAFDAAYKKYPEAFGISPQHGFMGALKSGAAQGIGSAAKGIGALAGAPGLESWGEKYAAPSEAAGAWTPTPEADTGVGAFINRNVAEPLGSMIGRYAIPTAAGAGAAMLAPEAGLFGLGAAGTAAALEGAGFVAANAPSAVGENLEEQEATTKARAAKGQAPLPYDTGTTVAAALAESALMPVLGHLGGAAMKYFSLLGPDLAVAAKAVMSGQMTQEAAVATLQSTAKNLIAKTAETAAVGVPMMTGTEAIKMGQAGEDLSSPESQQRLGESVKAGLAFAPVGGALSGLGMRGKQVKALEGAGKEWTGANEAAKAYGGDREQVAATEAAKQAAADQAAAQRAAIPVGEQLGLDIPEQPAFGQRANIEEELAQRQAALDALNTLKKAQLDSGMKDDAGETTKQIKQKVAEINYVKQAALKSRAAAPEEAAPAEAPAITRADFNEMGIPNGKTGKEVRAYEGVAAGSPQMGELRGTLGALINPDTAPKWMTDEKAAKIQAKLDSPLMLGEQQGLDMSFPTAEQSRRQAAQAQADSNTAAWEARMKAGREQAAIAKTPGAVRDLFTGKPEVTDLIAAEPVPEAPSVGTPEARAALAQKTLDAVALWKEGKLSDEALHEALTQARLNQGRQMWLNDAENQLIPPSNAAARAAYYEAHPELKSEGVTRGTTNDVPTDSAGAPKQRAGRAGNGESVPVSGRPESRAPAKAVGAGVLPDERPALGEKPVARALKEKLPTLADMAPTAAEKAYAAKRKAGIGANETLTEGPTGIGGAATATSLKELTPVFRPLEDVSKGAKGGSGAKLWWNDLAWMVRNKDSSPLAKEAIKQGLADGRFAKSHMDRAVTVDDANIAQDKQFKNAAREREKRRIANEKEYHKQVNAVKRGQVREVEDTATSIERVQSKKTADAAMMDRLAREEEARSAEVEQDPDAFMYSKRGPGELTGPAATIESFHQAVVSLLGGEGRYNKSKVQVYHTFADLPEELQKLFTEGTQAIATKGGKTIIIANRFQQGGERGGIMHEVGHIGLEKAIGADNVGRLHDRIQGWKTDPRARAVEREAVLAAENRIPESTRPEHRQEELIAYTAMELLNRGIKPETAGPGGQFLRALRNAFETVLRKLNLMDITEHLTGKDLIDILQYTVNRELRSGERAGTGAGEPMYSKRSEAHEAVQRTEARRDGERDYIADAIRKQLKIAKPKPETKAAPAEPDNVSPHEGSLVHKPVGEDVGIRSIYRAPEEKHGWGAAVKDSLTAAKEGRYADIASPIVKQALGIGGDRDRSLVDYIGNKIISNQFSFQQKSDKALGAELTSKETGRITGVSLHSAAKNNTQFTEEALATGYMAYDKETGAPVTVHDAVNNHAEFAKRDHELQDILLKRENGNKDAADSIHAALYYLPREAELADMGILPKDAAPEKARAELKELMADPEINKAFRAAKDIHDIIQKRMIDFDESSGRISAEEAAEYRKRPEYFALYRQLDEAGVIGGDPQFVQGLLKGKYQKHLTENIRQPGSPLDNLIRNSTWRIKAGLMTRAAEGVADDMVHIGAAEWVKSNANKDPNIVELLRRGETAFLKVKDKNDLMVFAATPVISGRIMGMFRGASNALRMGVTMMPMFAYRQLWQDAQHALVVGGYNISMVDAMRIGSKELWGNIKGSTENARILRQFGVTGQRDFVDTHANWVKDFEGNPQNAWHKATTALHRVANASDMAARAMVFEMAKKSGATDAAAAHAARMILNFNDKGSSRSLAAMMTMVPFINPRIQGNYRFYKALRGEIPGVTPEQGRRALLMKLSQMGLFTAGYALYNSGDPEHEDSIDDIEKRNHFVFKPFGVPMRVPVAGELLPIKVFVEALTRTAAGNARQDLGTNYKDAMHVLSAELFGFGEDFTPTLIKPIIENVTNYSILTGRPLVGAHMQGLDPNMQFSEGTSEIAKSVSDKLHAMGIGWSPIKIDNLLKGIFASTAVEAARLTNDALAFAKGEQRAPMRAGQLPVIGGAFYSERPGQALRADFVDLANQIGIANTSYNQMKVLNPQKAAEYRKEHEDLINAHGWADSIRKQMSMLDTQHKRAVASGEAAQVDAVERRRLAVLRNAKIQERRDKLL